MTKGGWERKFRDVADSAPSRAVTIQRTRYACTDGRNEVLVNVTNDPPAQKSQEGSCGFPVRGLGSFLSMKICGFWDAVVLRRRVDT
jgi:hypothetical protein